MAGGLGSKLFVSGDVLTAADMNGYFANQVMMRFATASARNASFGNGIPVGQTVGGVPGDGKPLLQEGMFAYLDDTNDVLFYNGATWVSAPQFVLGDNEVTTAKIVNSAVTAAKIASDAVTTAKILDANVTDAKLASDSVTTAKIADSAITSAKIADATIVNADISTTAAIDLGKLADATIDEKSASYTLVLTDKNKFIKMSVTTTANTVTVPTNASVAFPIGSQIHIIQYGSGKTQVIPVSGTVILYATPGAYLRAQYSSATLLKCDTNIWMLMGDLSAS